MADIDQLKEIARQIRIDIIRMLTEAGSGHTGGSLSAVEIVTALLFHLMRHDPQRPDWPERDRFVLSKGHGIPVWYAALARAGYFPLEELMTLRKTGSRLQGHPDRNKLPCLEACTGSLGQGLSIALGMAIASRMDNSPFRVYCLLGDGETQQGQIWEAAMAASKYQVDTLCAILDYNKAQIDGYVKDVMPIEPILDKWRSFGWHVRKIDGHSFEEIIDAVKESMALKNKPSFILADTIKGKGVSFMEGEVDWHGKAPKPDEAKKALAELGA